MTILDKIAQFFESKQLEKSSISVIAATSGGADSIAMAYVLKQLGVKVTIAHCNFQLRGNESDEDEEFVRTFSKNNNLELHVIRFDTNKYSEEHKLSIQVAARELRYNWFEKIRVELNADYVAIAHNQDDLAETFFINLCRGTGLKGLTGIKDISGTIIRPLLQVTRDEITEYLKINNLTYRNDSSNESDKYVRNKIRHHITPIFREINPSFLQTMSQNIERLNMVYNLLKDELISFQDKYIIQKANKTEILLDNRINKNNLQLMLFEFLNPYGFNETQIKNIIHTDNEISGKKIESITHILVKDRSKLLLYKKEELEVQQFVIKNIGDFDKLPFKIEYKTEPIANFILKKDRNIAAIDLDTLKFPLILRHWQDGDYFYPFGMRGKKKLSDFFIDRKVPLIEKNKIWILNERNNIVWILGMQTDDRYKITDKTKMILELKVKS